MRKRRKNRRQRSDENTSEDSARRNGENTSRRSNGLNFEKRWIADTSCPLSHDLSDQHPRETCSTTSQSL
jgi:hypothetical protein